MIRALQTRSCWKHHTLFISHLHIRELSNSLYLNLKNLTSLDRMIRIKPAVNKNEDKFEESEDGVPTPEDFEFDTSHQPDAKIGKKLLKLGKIYYRHIFHMPLWIRERIEEITSNRTPAQIRRCLKSWMIAYDREDQTNYKNKRLGWQSTCPTKVPKTIAYGPEETVAYAHYFFPSRYSITKRVLDEVKTLLPHFRPVRVLDFGCGLGTGFAAVSDVWNINNDNTINGNGLPRIDNINPNTPISTVKKYVGVDISQSMLDAAKIVSQNQNCTDCVFSDKISTVVEQAQESNERYDLILCTYTLTEFVTDISRKAATQLLFELLDENGVIVFVEPGNPIGSHTIRTARQVLINMFTHGVDASSPDTIHSGNISSSSKAPNKKYNHSSTTQSNDETLFDGYDYVNDYDDDSEDKNIPNTKSQHNDNKIRNTRKANFVLPPPNNRSTHTELQASVVSPCVHDKPCPLGPGIWCSFAQKVHSGMIRQESLEKFSYVVLRKIAKPGHETPEALSVTPTSQISHNIPAKPYLRERMNKTVSSSGKLGQFEIQKSDLWFKPSFSHVSTQKPAAESSNKTVLANLDSTIAKCILDPTPLSVLKQFMAITGADGTSNDKRDSKSSRHARVTSALDDVDDEFDHMDPDENDLDDFLYADNAQVFAGSAIGGMNPISSILGIPDVPTTDLNDKEFDKLHRAASKQFRELTDGQLGSSADDFADLDTGEFDEEDYDNEDDDNEDDDEVDEDGDFEDEGEENDDDEGEYSDYNEDERDDFFVRCSNKRLSSLLNRLKQETNWEQYNPPLYRDEWTRIIRSPIKGRRHVTMDLCHPSGSIQRHVLSKSQVEYVPALYKALRKTTWGGLFPAVQHVGDYSTSSYELWVPVTTGVSQSVQSRQKATSSSARTYTQSETTPHSTQDSSFAKSSQTTKVDIGGKSIVSSKVGHTKSSELNLIDRRSEKIILLKKGKHKVSKSTRVGSVAEKSSADYDYSSPSRADMDEIGFQNMFNKGRFEDDCTDDIEIPFKVSHEEITNAVNRRIKLKKKRKL